LLEGLHFTVGPMFLARDPFYGCEETEEHEDGETSNVSVMEIMRKEEGDKHEKRIRQPFLNCVIIDAMSVIDVC